MCNRSRWKSHSGARGLKVSKSICTYWQLKPLNPRAQVTLARRVADLSDPSPARARGRRSGPPMPSTSTANRRDSRGRSWDPFEASACALRSAMQSSRPVGGWPFRLRVSNRRPARLQAAVAARAYDAWCPSPPKSKSQSRPPGVRERRETAPRQALDVPIGQTSPASDISRASKSAQGQQTHDLQPIGGLGHPEGGPER